MLYVNTFLVSLSRYSLKKTVAIAIAMFSCALPDAYVAQLRDTSTLWINLEYLSAEPYVERSHRLPSPVFSGPAAGWTKRFFYPGFTPDTGGLLREADLLERQQALVEQGFIGQSALDESWRAFRVAQSQASSARAQSQAHAPEGLEQSLAHSGLKLAQANWAAARARLSTTEVRASFAGHVVSRHVEPGDTVQPGKTLLVLAPDGVTELVAQIDERNLSLLKVGQPAVASADAYPHQPFAAVVSRIAPGVDAQRGAVQVNLTVQTPPAYLRQDMTISIEIEVLRKPAALTLSLEAVHDIESSQPWVWSLDQQDRVQRTPVTLGVRAGSRVEVLSGLTVGARVMETAVGLKAGQRIRVAHGG